MEDKRQLLENFLDGRCTQEELRAVNLLLNCDAGREMLDGLIEQRESDELKKTTAPEAAEWIHAKKSELQHYMTRHDKRRRLFSGRVLMRVAAVFAGLMLISGALVWQMRGGDRLFGGSATTVELAELTNVDGVPELFTLPDGSQVWLAAGSTLKYPEEFSKKHRDVELSGEAFFDVERDENRPFTIKTGKLQTRVLGTSFKITAFEGHEHEVAVATGKVSVSHMGKGISDTKELALLTRGASVRHNPATGETTQSKIDPETLESWKTGTLIFDELPMKLVARQLVNRYGIDIVFADPQAESLRMSGTFMPEEPVAIVLDALCLTGGFHYENKIDNRYTIY